MVYLDIVKSANITLVKSQPLVAVVTGGTSGIGEATVHALATARGKDGKGLRVYIVGRKEGVAKSIISECLKVCPKGDFRFVRAEDLSLLKDVDRVCTEITKAEEAEMATGQKPRVDVLVMCHAHLSFEGRHGTSQPSLYHYVIPLF
jgi:NAD(P)-dependent dehydrogenase (short-subunit alcohol dehydrogenase family)